GRKQYEAAQAYFDESVIIKREIKDQRGLASVLINLALLRISQDRWQEVKPLAEESATLAEETQADEPLATAHMLLGLVNQTLYGDTLITAYHYSQAVAIAWEYHPITGQRINRAILRHLADLNRQGLSDWVQVICKSIVETSQERIS